MNLGATFLGIPITVLFVDARVQRNEAQRWADVDRRIGHHLERIANAAIANYCDALAHDLPISAQSLERSQNHLQRRQMLIDEAANELLQDIDDLEKLPRQGWRSFMESLVPVYQEAERTLDIYGNRMEPETQVLVIRLLEALEAVDSTRQLYGKYLCALGESLPPLTPDGVPPESHRKVTLSLACQEGTAVLQAAIAIEQLLNSHEDE